MSVETNIGADRWPKQGAFLGRRCKVVFDYDTSRQFSGRIVRDDAESPGRLIIQLDNGRFVLSTECQYSPDFSSRPAVPAPGADQ